MKKSLILGAILAAVGLAIFPAHAQTQSTTTSTTTSYIPSSKIIGSRIRGSDGAEVGVIKDVVLDRQTGCMAYTVLETSGGGNVAGTSGKTTSTTTTTRKTGGDAVDGVQRQLGSDRLHDHNSARKNLQRACLRFHARGRIQPA